MQSSPKRQKLLCKKLRIDSHLDLSNPDFTSIIKLDVKKFIKRNPAVPLTDLFFNKSVYPSDHLLARFASSVYSESEDNERSEQGWILLTTASNHGNGYFGAAYWSSDHWQVVVAHKGTGSKGDLKGISMNPIGVLKDAYADTIDFVKDIWTDINGIINNNYVSQMNSAATFANQVVTELIKINAEYEKNLVFLSLSFTGHSLGGWLAQITTFTAKYLKPGNEGFFVDDQQDALHLHTVVFDSPGSKDMLLKMKDDFSIRYDSMISLSLDITIYLSAPNMFNTCNAHLNTAAIYRVFIESLPSQLSVWDFIKYSVETHRIDNIEHALVVGERNSSGLRSKVIDWPVVKKGIIQRISSIFKKGVKSVSFCILRFTASGQPLPDTDEYEYFHKFANYANKYNPCSDKIDYCTIRYQVENVTNEECSANIFSQSEFQFLVRYQWLRKCPILLNVDELFSFFGQSEKEKKMKDEIKEVLDSFEITKREDGSNIKCISEEKLHKLVTYVKNMLFLKPNIKVEAEEKLKTFTIHKKVYELESNNYLQSIESIELKKASMENLVAFLKETNLQLLQQSFEMNIVVGVKKIYKVLKEIKSNYQTSEAFFLRLEQLLYLEKYLKLTKFLEHSDGKTPELFIVECKELSMADALLKSLITVLRDKPNFKFIFVTQKAINMKEILESNEDLYIEKIDSSRIQFSDFTNHSQKQILERNIHFQGKEICLSTLIDDESKYLVNEETLSKLISNDKVEINNILSDSSACGSYYIDRVFYRHVPIRQDIKEEKSEFFITDSNQVNKLKLQKGKNIGLISEECSSFDEENNVDWLDMRTNKFVWQKSLGALSKSHEFVDITDVEEYSEDEIVNTVDNIVVISAESGMGKSTILTKLTQKMKMIDSSLWLARINLNDITPKLSEVYFNNDKDKIIDFLLDVTGINTPFEKNLFKHKVSHQGKYALLFDGFDEIVPTYKEKVIELFKVLKDMKTGKIWITTRPHMRNELEDKLTVLSYRLKLLSTENQEMLLKHFWSTELRPTAINEERLNIYVNKLLDFISKSVFDEKRTFTGIPLHIKMIAEALQEKFKKFHNDCSQIQPNFSENLDSFLLYDFFVKRKHDRYLVEKKGLVLTRTGTEVEMSYKRFVKQHSLYAVSVLFHTKRFLFWDKINKIENFKKRIKDGVENVGIVNPDVSKGLVFIHRSFAEYFSAVWFSEEKNIRKKNVKDFLFEQLFTDENKVIRSFFDHMLAKSEQNKNECEIHTAVLNNDKNRIESLLQERENIINTTDKAGRTALHIAAAYGYLNIVKILLDHNFSISIKDQLFDWSPLRYADKCGHWDVAELLLQKEANPDDMHEAKCDLQNYEVNMENCGITSTLLHVAAEKGLVNLSKFIIETKHMLINEFNKNLQTPLYLAAENGHLHVAELLIKHGANINISDYFGVIPLHLAAVNGHKDVVKLLIDNSNDKNTYVNKKTNRDKWSPLHFAVNNGSIDAIQLLIDNANDKNNYVWTENENGLMSLHLAAINGDKDIVKLLIDNSNDKDAYVNKETNSNKGMFRNSALEKGLTSLHLAAINGHKDVVKLLIDNSNDKDAYVNKKNNSNKWTPLHFAVKNGNIDVIQLLIDNANDKSKYVWTETEEGQTSLHIAACAGHKDAAKLLIVYADNADIYVKKKGKQSETPLYLAATFDKVNIAEFLINNVKDKDTYVKERSIFGFTPLHIAAFHGYKKIIQVLIANVNNADIYVKDKNNNGFIVEKRILFLNDTDTNILRLAAEGNGNFGWTSLHLAASNGHKDCAEVLIDNVKDKKNYVQDETGRLKKTALDLARENSHYDVVKLLEDISNKDL